MDYCVQLGFDNINSPELDGYGVDHQKRSSRDWAASTSACTGKKQIEPAIRHGAWLDGSNSSSVPVVIEVMLERVTNIAMGTEIDAINEFEELAIDAKDAPTAVGLLD